MADTELTISINHPRLRSLYRISDVTHQSYFAIAAVTGLAAIYFLACPWGPAFACAHPTIAMSAISVVSALVIGNLLVQLMRAALSKEMFLSRDGLHLPFMLGRLNHVKLWQSWTNVTGATVNSDDDNNLLLQLQSGKSIAVPMRGMEPQSIEQLLLSIELWGTNCTRSQDLIDYQAELHNANKGLSQLSYTDMWNDELGRRFASTTFVPLEPGATLKQGRLTVVRQLAFGGLSAIYLVQDGQKEMRVLKEAVVPASMEIKNQEAAENALNREAGILAQLRHPNIVQVLDNFTEAGQHYLVLQHIAGQDLRQLVRQNGPQPEEKVLGWALQIASALDYLHSWNPPIIHRDLTPENIVLKNDGTIVIIDFGASNQFLGTMTGTIVGKQAYMAPEQVQGKATTQSDIYAFGGTLNFLLTGKDPIPLSESQPSDKVSLSPELNGLVRACTALETASRCHSMDEVRVKLTEIYSQKGIARLFSGSS